MNFGFIRTSFIPVESYYNKPCMEFDPISGFKWLPAENCRTVRLYGNEVIFDQTFKPNNLGYISQQNYRYRKCDPHTYRFVVFGDSFTSGHFLEAPWPDRLQQFLASTAPSGRKYEVYSFAVNGGGIANWHRIFFQQVVSKFDFDALIIASFVDNLARPFSIFHATDEGVYFERFPEAPHSREEFLANYFPTMKKLYQIRKDSKIEEILKQRRRALFLPFKLYALRFLLEKIKAFRIKSRSRDDAALLKALSSSNTDVSRTALEGRYGEKGLSQLTDILDCCHEKRIPVILSPIPSREGLIELFRTNYSNQTIHQLDLSRIAQDYGADYFDGYKIFEGIDEKQIVNHYFLKFDPHWALPGSDLFARRLSEYIRERFASRTN